MALPSSELADLLPDWLARQRWFAAKGRQVRSVAVAASSPLITGDGGDDLLLDHTVLAVEFTDGGPVQHYQLLVARRPQVRTELEHVTIGRVDKHIAYDGLWDHEVTDWLLDAIRTGLTVGDIRFVPEPGAEIPEGVGGRVIGVEQSNTSVAYGEKSIFKLFRRLAPGSNPDLELHRALRSVGSEQVAALQGAVEGTLDGQPATLGMLQDFAANSADGWAMALASVRDLLAEADLRADEVGGDFAGEAYRLGETVAIVHDELARALGTTQVDPAEVAEGMMARLAATAVEVPRLAVHTERIRATYEALGASDAPIRAQRIHGDLHLGQTLRIPWGWLLIDFEGEPAKPLAERVRPDSALRDVAGMLRSFDYAAFHQVSSWEAGELFDADQDSQLMWRANEWAARNRSAFCDGYAARAGADPRAQGTVLRAFELDKAVYEVLYETRSRPSWVSIPLASISRLTTETDSVT
ncbi:aminoglycoside phosphotransferase [Pseudonocardia sp. K10HN5]|uniref:Maltokinase n=1 Tax=Pseudonocardia acidicola TaxID=2724939 RepID=A0ABX1SKQ4_9PSEU|nr:aminoglycoside phosphotransferase [Pseudonocardia acidicola]NMI02117.1 aminoglycoside phosphotransferase [Pseudonocardia acidicola]